jgi:hypothetical protein
MKLSIFEWYSNGGAYNTKTFKHIEGSQDGKDKNGCYRYGEKVDCKVLLEDE